MKLKGKTVRVVKLEDTKFNGNHPNGVVEGTERTGQAYFDLEIGKCFWLNNFTTSPVTEINETNMTFNTLNSVYKFEIIE